MAASWEHFAEWKKIDSKLKQRVRLSRTRLDYLEKFQQMIDEYTAGSVNIDKFFRHLMEFAANLKEEGKRAIAEQLSEQEPALFDILTKPDVKLTEKEKNRSRGLHVICWKH